MFEYTGDFFLLGALITLGNKVFCQSNTEGVRDVQYILWPLKEVWIKVGLEKLENYEGVAVKYYWIVEQWVYLWTQSSQRKKSLS